MMWGSWWVHRFHSVYTPYEEEKEVIKKVQAMPSVGYKETRASTYYHTTTI